MRRKLARPPAPSSRVRTAAAVAAAVGAITFVIWFATARRFVSPSATPDSSLRRAKPADETSLPRGGSLTGSIRPEDEQLAVRLLTQATLVRINRSTDQVEPWLAESWTVANDNLTYTFKLRPNILWADGRPLAADDVVAAFAATNATARVMGKPLIARALGASQVEITFPAPFAPALRLLDDVPLPPGLGPFVLSSPKSGERLRFERNPRYWRTAPDGKALPYLDAIVLNVIPDQNAELQQLLAAQLDFVQTEIRPEDHLALERADQAGKIRLYDLEAGLDADALWMNVSKMWLAKDDFRLALSVAVNRRAFCDAVYLGACDPIWGPITPGNPAWFNPDLPSAGPDQVLARAMLAGIGLQDRNADGLLDDEQGRTLRVTILVARGSTRDGLGARFVRDELRKIGIAAEVTEVEPDVLNARRARGDYDAIFSRFTPADTDPAMNLDFWQQWESTSWGTQIADLMRKQAATGDRVERVQLFADVQKLYAQHMPALFLGAPYAYVATGMRVLNAKPSRRRPSLLWSADTLAATTR
jgi:peptide/nickel transport system substrate-binding protein